VSSIAATAPRIGQLRFLVVEDHGFQRWALANTLGALGARSVMSAAGGEAALEIIDALDEPLDVVVTDLHMPGMDGMEFIRHLGRRKLAAGVMLVSALEPSLVAAVEVMAKAYGVYLLACIEKPATARKVEDALLHFRQGIMPRAPREIHEFGAGEVAAALANGELQPFFQPQIALRGGAVAGAEALARWRHPTRGLLAASSFMESFRSPELARKLTLLMCRGAAQACRAWRAAGMAGTVSVNITARTLDTAAIAERLLEIVHDEGIAPADITFEVNEAAASTPEALETLSRLRMQGCGLAIDDYGIGYSSMEGLARVAFTELKVAPSFVQQALRHGASRHMLESSLEIARKMKIVSVAKAVERQDELDLLRELGCDRAQGALIGRPMELSSYLAWGRERRCGA
jgi:EAL domain-containing protein (putative c-di-GMP-specific phosphodiesterase class I)/ActR/RegA family two-component response regulator